MTTLKMATLVAETFRRLLYNTVTFIYPSTFVAPVNFQSLSILLSVNASILRYCLRRYITHYNH